MRRATQAQEILAAARGAWRRATLAVVANRMLGAAAPVALMGLMGLAGGCDFQLSGKDGNFTFSYDHPGLWSFKTPVAVGTKVAIRVADEDGEPVDVDSAGFSEAAHFQTAGAGVGYVIVRALKAGKAELVVDGTRLSDRVDIEARDVGKVELDPPAAFGVDTTTESRRADEPGKIAGVQHGQVLLKVDLRDSGGRLLIGYGLDGFTVSPATAGSVTWRDEAGYIHALLSGTGKLTFDHPQATAPVELDVVAETDIATLGWRNIFTSGPGKLQEDSLGVLFLEALLADGQTSVLGLHPIVDYESLTPETCSIVAVTDGYVTILAFGNNFYEVRTIKPGTCTLRAALDALGLETTYSYEVEAKAR